jgi:hypothetical protein
MSEVFCYLTLQSLCCVFPGYGQRNRRHPGCCRLGFTVLVNSLEHFLSFHWSPLPTLLVFPLSQALLGEPSISCFPDTPSQDSSPATFES